MDVLRNPSSGQNTALVILAFLQADCRSAEYRNEIFSLGQDINLTRDINWNGLREDPPDDGALETDGHLSCCIKASWDDIQPSADLQRPDAVALQQVVEELREIADQLEHNIVAQATQNLRRNILRSPFIEWENHLSWEVDRVMRQGVNLRDLAQEQVLVALTLTLVKGVCQQSPQLLRNLFNTVLQYISHATSR